MKVGVPNIRAACVSVCDFRILPSRNLTKIAQITLVTACLAFGFAGCSKADDKKNNPSGEASSESRLIQNSRAETQEVSSSEEVSFTLYNKFRPGFMNLDTKNEVYYEYKFSVSRNLIQWPPNIEDRQIVKAMAIGILLPIEQSPHCQGLSSFMGTFGIAQPGVPQWFYDNKPYPEEGDWRGNSVNIPGFDSFEIAGSRSDSHKVNIYISKDKRMAVRCHIYRDSSKDLCNSAMEIPIKGASGFVLSSGYSPKSEGVNVESSIKHMKCIREQAPLVFKEISYEGS